MNNNDKKEKLEVFKGSEEEKKIQLFIQDCYESGYSNNSIKHFLESKNPKYSEYFEEWLDSSKEK